MHVSAYFNVTRVGRAAALIFKFGMCTCRHEQYCAQGLDHKDLELDSFFLGLNTYLI